VIRQKFAALTGSTAVRYLFFGGIAFLVDFGLLALGYQVIGLPLEVATGCAFLISFFFTYAIQRAFAFRSETPHGRSLVRYAILVGFNTLATILIVWLVDSSALGWGAGKVIATLVSTVWNYFAYRYWIFRKETVTHV
jgi:putative flippase GtrA